MTLKRLAANLLGASALVLTGCGVLLDGPATRREALAETRFPPGGEMIELTGGRRVHAVIAGDGPDLILIHGASGNTRDFTFSFMERLTDRYRVVAFDRPGLGHTGRASDSFGGPFNTSAESVAEQAAMLKEAADIIGVRAPIVLGQSYGGAVALSWALNYDPSAVVIVSGTSHPWPGGRLGIMYDLAAGGVSGAGLAPVITTFARRGLIEHITADIFDPQDVPEGYLDYVGADLSLRREALWANARQVYGLWDDLSKMAPRYPALDLPIEIVHGKDDAIVPFDQHGRRLVQDVPSASATLLDGVGHMPHHAAPDAVEAAIDRAATRAGLR